MRIYIHAGLLLYLYVLCHVFFNFHCSFWMPERLPTNIHISCMQSFVLQQFYQYVLLILLQSFSLAVNKVSIHIHIHVLAFPLPPACGQSKSSLVLKPPLYPNVLWILFSCLLNSIIMCFLKNEVLTKQLIKLIILWPLHIVPMAKTSKPQVRQSGTSYFGSWWVHQC